MEDRIKVIDSPCGSGKTSYAIQKINEYGWDRRVIYITPFLSEVDRIIASCPDKHFVQPDRKLGKGSKLTHLIKLVSAGENIASTHALFSEINDELIEALRVNNYTLFLDEAFQTVEKFNISEVVKTHQSVDEVMKQDVKTLLNSGIIGVNEDFSVQWLDDSKSLSKYNQIKNLAQRGLLYLVNGCLLLWTFPIEVFEEGIFDEVYILTHMFDAQLQAYYYKYFDLEYTKYYVFKQEDGTYEITKWNSDKADHEKEWKQHVKGLIHIIDESRLNKIGDPFRDGRRVLVKTALSDSWYRNNPNLISKVRNNLENFFKNITHSKSEQRLWTCYKIDQKTFKSKNLSTKYWIALNSRSMNEWGDRSVIAYPINRFLDPFYVQFFKKKNVMIDEDAYALSEMMQFIWRSAIRNDKEITLYVPSYRMRNLLKNYLNS